MQLPRGVVVQLVRIPACHAGGRGFESRPLRQGFYCLLERHAIPHGGIAQLGERLHGMQEVSGSIPLTSTTKLIWSWARRSRKGASPIHRRSCDVEKVTGGW